MQGTSGKFGFRHQSIEQLCHQRATVALLVPKVLFGMASMRYRCPLVAGIKHSEGPLAFSASLSAHPRPSCGTPKPTAADPKMSELAALPPVQGLSFHRFLCGGAIFLSNLTHYFWMFVVPLSIALPAAALTSSTLLPTLPP